MYEQTVPLHDSGNAEYELLCLDHSATYRKVRVVIRFFSVRRRHSGDATNLFECLKQAVKYVRLPNEWNKKIFGFGCDGTSVNIGLNMYLQQTAPWIEVFWCPAHCLELSLKDAVKDTLFVSINEMLLHVYYLYETSPKNVVN